MTSALRHLPGALLGAGDLLKGLAWSLSLRTSGVRRIRYVTELEALGGERLETLRYRTASGIDETVQANVLLIHEGVVPSVHTAMALGCAMIWRDDQDCYVPVLDPWGESSHPNFYIAGDGADIAGAKAAALRGEIAALGIAARLGRISSEAAAVAARTARAKLKREMAIRPFLDAMFRPRHAIFAPEDETVICRCEEITAREIRCMARSGRQEPNQVKAFTRAGMGPCQGRQCGYTVARMLAAAEGRAMDEVGFYRIRPPLKPVTLGELASLDEGSP
jgi:NADPH-dependent 2,4-dienoyl-CoA reductase/sulfur reductase-like enzyme